MRRERRLLVVDDEEGVRNVVSALLELYGYRVTTASDAAHALAVTAERDFDLVLTDVLMPGMSGFELGRRLARDLPHLPVVYMSGHIENLDDAQLLTNSPVYFVAKPFNVKALAHALDQALSGCAEAQQAPRFQRTLRE